MKDYLRISLFIFLLSLTTGSFAQLRYDTELEIKRKEFKTLTTEGLAEAWAHVLTGNEYYEAGPGTFGLAREHYLLAHQYNPENSVLNFRIGICYLYTDDKYEALRYLRAAFDKSPDLHPELHYYLARSYHLVLEFDKALEHYRKQKEIYVSSGSAQLTSNIDKRMMECENGKVLLEEPRRVIITNLGDSINSQADDYNPVLNADGSIMYFTSRRPDSEKSKRNPYDNKFYENVYMSTSIDGEWSGAIPFAKKLKSGRNDAIAGISNDGTILYIYKGGINGGDIYYSEFNPKKSTWKSPKAMPSRLLSKQAEGTVFQTITDDTLYYISANEKYSQGGKDIFFTIRNEKGKWQHPKNLGSLINTPFDEEGIYLSPSGKDLYFSSKGHNSMGGYDVFHSVKLDDGTWSDPENMGYPVNTPDDEIFFRMAPNGKSAWYTTIRENVVGGKDIYKLVFLGAEKELRLSKEDILIAGSPESQKTGFFSMPEAVTIDSFYYLTGHVYDKKSEEPVFAKIEFIDVDNSQNSFTTVTDEEGKFIVKFSEAKNYGVEVIAKDYLFYLDMVDLRNASSDEPDTADFYLEKVEVGAKVVLENIYFETGKATLMSNSYTQLNQVVSFMENNETIRLEISGHTDNTGSLKVNTRLSEERAKAVVDYLTANGISLDRFEWKGYAFSQPIAPNDTAEGREKNRRVEFKVLSK